MEIMNRSEMFAAIDKLGAHPSITKDAKTLVKRCCWMSWQGVEGDKLHIKLLYECEQFVEFAYDAGPVLNSDNLGLASELISSFVNDPVREALELVAEATQEYHDADEAIVAASARCMPSQEKQARIRRYTARKNLFIALDHLYDVQNKEY